MTPALALLLGGGAGSALASFAGVVAARGWRRACRGRSACDACGRSLGWTELVPVLSHLALRGRCRGCGVRIGRSLLIAELAGAAAGVGVALLALAR